jgi:hypothetical protein
MGRMWKRVHGPLIVMRKKILKGIAVRFESFAEICQSMKWWFQSFHSEVAIMFCEPSESIQISTLSRLKSFSLLKYDVLIIYTCSMSFFFVTNRCHDIGAGWVIDCWSSLKCWNPSRAWNISGRTRHKLVFCGFSSYNYFMSQNS